MKAIAAYIGLSENATESEVLARLKVLMSEKTDVLIEMGKQRGIINGQNEAQYRKLAEADFDSTKTLILSEKPAQSGEGAQSVSVTDIIKALKGEGASVDKSTWNFNDWSEKDPSGLEKMRAEEPEKYGALAKSYTPPKR